MIENLNARKKYGFSLASYSREFVTLVPSLLSQLCYQRLQMPSHTRCILVSELLYQDPPQNLCRILCLGIHTCYLGSLLPPHGLAAC